MALHPVVGSPGGGEQRAATGVAMSGAGLGEVGRAGGGGGSPRWRNRLVKAG